jgi:hypothetical protein
MTTGTVSSAGTLAGWFVMVTTDCQSCHVPARQSDWIYTHGYPVLTR